MQISESSHGAWTILTLVGKTDQSGADALKMALLPRMTGGAVALDFSGVEYITSTGFRVLMLAEREQRAKKGELVLGNMNDPVRRFFDMAGLGSVFRIVDDLNTAIDSKR